MYIVPLYKQLFVVSFDFIEGFVCVTFVVSIRLQYRRETERSTTIVSKGRMVFGYVVVG